MSEQQSDTDPSGDKKSYDASSIRSLEGLEAVRMRPAMYIGDTGAKGLHHLVWEVVDNSVDEALAGFASRVDVRVHEDGSVSVSDNGRGIPVDMHETGVPAVEAVLTQLHTGGKFDKGSYKVSGGLHGVGVSCVNALALSLEVQVHRDGKVYRQTFERGERKTELEVLGDTDQTGTTVRFSPDPSVMEVTEFNYDVLRKRLRELAYLMGTYGLQLTLHDERNGKDESYRFPEGVKDFVSDLNTGKTPIHPSIIYIRKEQVSDEDPDRVYEIELALQYNDGFNEGMFTFVNNINTIEGGTHLAGFRSALTRTLNNYGRSEKILKPKDNAPSGDDFREGLTAVLSVKVPEPQFESQTKIKLGNREVQGIVEMVVGECMRTWCEENPQQARAVFYKVLLTKRARDEARKAKDSVIRRKSGLEGPALPAKLTDCQKGTAPEDAELFLVEGDSAGGTAKQGRTPNQGVLALRGKILNVEKASIDKILDHKEIQAIVAAIGTGYVTEEFEPDRLRYHKIIIMTDADIDGSHIRTLLLTLFYRKMPELITRGHVYVARPPLFKMKKGKKERYVVDQREYAAILTEFGLGETKLVHHSDSGDRTFDGAELRSLLDLLGRIAALEASITREAEIDYGAWIAAARQPDLDLPGFVYRQDGVASFIDTEHQVAAEVEKLSESLGRPARLYQGPDSGFNREDADAEAYALPTRDQLKPLLRQLEDAGISPHEFTGEEGRARFTIDSGKRSEPCGHVLQAFTAVKDDCEVSVEVQRYKGLGEMKAEQLYESTMDSTRRTLSRVTIEDAVEADKVFTVLMGPEVEPRRDFIEKYALEVTNLDV